MTTLLELFPKDKFPLRAQLSISIPELKFSLRVKIYYSRPPATSLDDAQEIGTVAEMISQDEKLRLRTVWVGPVVSSGLARHFYVGEKRKLKKVSQDEHDKAFIAFCQKFKESTGIDLKSDETNKIMLKKTDEACWKPF